MSLLPDFEGLAMFAKVAEERSFAGAARALGVSVAIVPRGTPQLPSGLAGHPCPGYAYRAHSDVWRFTNAAHCAGRPRHFRVPGLHRVQTCHDADYRANAISLEN
jgi:hypothetical protein